QPAGGALPRRHGGPGPGERAPVPERQRARGAHRQPGGPHGLGQVRRTDAMERLARLMFLCPALLVACATSGTPAPATAPAAAAKADVGVSETGTPDAPFRKTLPEAGAPVVFKAPVPTVTTLKNGLAVWIVEQHDVPLTTVELVVRAG